MLTRKYVGVPTQQEIIEQFNEVSKKIKNITTFEQIEKFLKNKEVNEIEINYSPLYEYDGEPIEVIRYDYKNILVYVYIENKEIKINECITLYDDYGDQFADERFDNYEKEIERVAKMGRLELA